MNHSSRRSNRSGPALAAAVGVALVLAPAPAALGQAVGSAKKEELRPPVAPLSTSASAPYIPMGVGLLLAALVIGMNFIPSKRGHQD
jgi:hypothetical protein